MQALMIEGLEDCRMGEVADPRPARGRSSSTCAMSACAAVTSPPSRVSIRWLPCRAFPATRSAPRSSAPVPTCRPNTRRAAG